MQALIQIVDDVRLNREILVTLCEHLNYRVIEAVDGAEAITQLEAEAPDLVLLDIHMPIMDGFEVLKKMQAAPNLRSIPVIIVSAEDERDTVAKAVKLGAVDVLTKPVDPVLLQARIKTSLDMKMLRDLEVAYTQHIEHYTTRLEERVTEQISQLTASHTATIFAMSKLAESRDPETGAHIERVREYCGILAEVAMDIPALNGLITQEFVQAIFATSPLHDVGKVGIPDMILLKPDRLDDDEMRLMQTHTTIGSYTLRKVIDLYPDNRFISMAIEIAQSHHEKWDGSGYPDQLVGEDIPISARIMAIADVYDALRSRRIYKPAFPIEKTLAILNEGDGKHFDPTLMSAFREVSGKFDEVFERFAEQEEADLAAALEELKVLEAIEAKSQQGNQDKE